MYMGNYVCLFRLKQEEEEEEKEKEKVRKKDDEKAHIATIKLINSQMKFSSHASQN